MTPFIAIYALGVGVWIVGNGLLLQIDLDLWRNWGGDEDLAKVKRQARLLLLTPVWPLGALAIALAMLRTLIRYAQGKVPE